MQTKFEPLDLHFNNIGSCVHGFVNAADPIRRMFIL